MADALAVTLHASATRTESSSGPAADLGEIRTAVDLSLRVTAASGDDRALVVTIETSPDGTSGWALVDSFESVNSSGRSERVFSNCDRYVRASWTVRGAAPSFTFAVAGHAHVLLATWNDVVEGGMVAEALDAAPEYIRARHLLQATEKSWGLIGSGYELPLTSWGHDVRSYTAALATASLMRWRGFAADGSDVEITEAEKLALRQLEKIGNGKLTSPATVDQTPTVSEYSAAVASSAARTY